MATDKEVYDLVADLAPRARYGGLFLATVKGIDPLVITIGGKAYSAKDWAFYAPYFEGSVEAKKLTSTTASMADGRVSVGQNARLNIGQADIKEARAEAAFKPGDLLLVYERESGAEFIIITKVRRVL